MGKKRNQNQGSVSPGPVTSSASDVFDIGSLFDKPTLPHKSGRGRTALVFHEFRITNGILNLDYTYTVGACSLTGTLGIKAHKGEPIYDKILELVELCEDAFHRVRKARD